MSLYELLTGGGLSLLGLITIVQIAPIKINPWTTIARGLGKAIMHDTASQLKKIEEKVDDMQERHIEYEKKKDKESMDDCRSRILRFGDECRRDVKHSREFFDQILTDITRYEHYCELHPEYENSKAVLTIEKIKKVYHKCDDENSFL